MKIVLKLLKNEKTQILDNIISLSELENIIQMKTKENFKVDESKVSIFIQIESSDTTNKEKLIAELNRRMDTLLELQKQNKITNGFKVIEEIKNYIKNYDGVSDKDKKELIDNIDMMVLEIK